MVSHHYGDAAVRIRRLDRRRRLRMRTEAGSAEDFGRPPGSCQLAKAGSILEPAPTPLVYHSWLILKSEEIRDWWKPKSKASWRKQTCHRCKNRQMQVKNLTG
ncbi:unnamed protein product [Phytophthora fragariaefolia]|uniref:Unnamed protein product n=1 Tax=Phytophthora fragariaefolia TaxID=1490495 RepID=A0A9W6X3C9_9STRA|nr:unnamed protein product [Phytophthora fragariaefolia]